jgi:hypothetical protein
MLEHFAQGTAITATDNENIGWRGVSMQCHLGKHFMIKMFVPLGELDNAIESQHLAKIRAFEYK